MREEREAAEEYKETKPESDEGKRKEEGDKAERGGREGSYETSLTRNWSVTSRLTLWPWPG